MVRRGIGGVILLAAPAVAVWAVAVWAVAVWVVPVAVGAELGQPAPDSTIKRISPRQGGGSGGIGGLAGFPGHSTAPGRSDAIPRQPERFHRSVIQGPDGAEIRVITLGSPAGALAGVPPLPRPRPVRAGELEMASLETAPGDAGVTRLGPGMRPLRWPLTGALVNSGYGPRRHPILGGIRNHGGVDLPAPTGTPVRAAADGFIRYFGRNGSYGRFIRLDHGFGLETAYGHLRRYASSLRRNTRVRRGEVIGYAGSSGLSTGPHLHYEVRINGRTIDPLPVMPAVVRRSRPP